MDRGLSLVLIILSLVAIAGIVGFLLWHIARTTKRRPPGRVPVTRRLSRYLSRHRLVAVACVIALAFSLTTLGVGVVNALPSSGDARSASEQTAQAPASSSEPGTSPAASATPTASAAPSTQPSPTPGTVGQYAAACPAYPAFPDEYCTGWKHTGVKLHNCDAQTDKGYIWDDGVKTFDSCYFSRQLTVQGAHVTITRSQVHGGISTHWSNNYDFRGLTLADVEIEDQGNPNADSAAIGGNNFSCTRCNVHHTGTGIHFGDGSVVRDSFTHDFNYSNEAHGSGVAAGQGTGSNSMIVHNNIQCNRLVGQPTICSSALSIYAETNKQGGTVHDVRVEKNLFNTTGAYCVYAGGLPATNIDFIDNRFGKKFSGKCAGYGPVASYQPAGGKWINNVWADGSGPVVP